MTQVRRIEIIYTQKGFIFTFKFYKIIHEYYKFHWTGFARKSDEDEEKLKLF